MRRVVIVAVVVVIACATFSAQVSGRVYVQLDEIPHDDRSFSKQAWASVFLDSLETETDSTGAFVFDNTEPGKHLLRCEVFGTEGASTFIIVGENDIENANLVVPEMETRFHYDPSDDCWTPILAREDPDNYGYLPVDTLINPYEPVKGVFRWGEWSGHERTRTVKRDFGLFEEEGWYGRYPYSPLACVQARDTVWLVISNSGILGCDECCDQDLWLRTSPDSGKSWDAPLHLGLIRTNCSNTESLRIAVYHRWLCLDLGFEVRPTMEHSQVRIPLTVLRSDRDGDGITDLAEPFFALDPDNPDTDLDGLWDYEDPNPLVQEDLTDEIAVMFADLTPTRVFDDSWWLPDSLRPRYTFSDTSDILRRPIVRAAFGDECQRAIPVDSGWAFCMDPRKQRSFNERVGCYYEEYFSVLAWNPDWTCALVGGGGWKVYWVDRIVFRKGKWRYGGRVRLDDEGA
jgi:hypothetical protein